jgi:zinc transporter
LSCDAILVGDGPVRHLGGGEAAAYAGPGFIWFHIEGCDERDLAAIRAQPDIPDVAANALVATETRPRCDRIEDGAIVNLRGLAAADTGDSDRLVSIRMWVRQGRVYSVTRRPLAATPVVTGTMEKGRIHDPGDLVAAFAGAISTQLDPEVAELGDNLDSCETELDPAAAYRLRILIARIRADAIGFRRFVAPDRDALQALAGLEFEWLAEEDRLHIREAADRFARMTEELESVRERAALLHEQLTDLRSEQMEGRALLISIVALIFLPLTFITGLFGMNVKDIPFEDAHGAFWSITGVCLAMALLIAAFFSRKHWLGR